LVNHQQSSRWLAHEDGNGHRPANSSRHR
jgi:hypothetical protein